MSSGRETDPFEVFGQVEVRVEPKIANPGAVKPAFSWAALAAGFAAPLWAAGTAAAAYAYYGADGLLALDVASACALGAGVLAPALLFWTVSASAADAATARKLAVELARLARESHLPFEAGHGDARSLGATIRSEIDALADAVGAAMSRLHALEEAAKRSAALFDDTVHASSAQVEAMGAALRRERDALVGINSDLRGQTEAVAETIGRQVRLMREASKIVKSEIAAAESALSAHLNRFSESTGSICEHTEAFQDAAEQASAVTGALNETLLEMLDSMSEATRLADAARRSSEQAVLVANDTAGALRETTRSAVAEAQRAAQMMRAETQAIQLSAANTLSKLHDAAQAARDASEESQAAANRHAATAARGLRRDGRKERTGDYAAPEAARTRRESSFGSWGNFTPQPAKHRPSAANEDTFDLLGFGDEQDPDICLKGDALELVTEAGVALSDVLGAGDLERIARHSRNGASARRAAVRDAAPGAVTRIARYVRHNTKAHTVANEFRARPDLAKSERKADSSNLVRAYLLIDAALS